MQKHELTCTLNPKRGCWVCEKARDFVTICEELKKRTNLDIGSVEDLAWLEGECESCPACMLAAIRITTKATGEWIFPEYIESGKNPGHFDYKKAMSEWYRSEAERKGEIWLDHTPL